MKQKERGITLVALIVTIIILIILAAVTIKAAFDSNFMGIATKSTEDYAKGQVKEEEMIDNTAEYIEEAANNIANAGQGGAGENPTNPEETEKPALTPTSPIENWNKDKVYEAISEDNIIVPVPKEFTISEEIGEKSVKDGFVIKNGVNEFVWVPVANPSEMFGKDKDGNFLGKLYDFSSGTPTALNWTETDGVMSWTSSTSNREPDVVNSDNTSSYYTNAGIIGIKNASQFKEQLQNEFKAMKESVEKYGGFYIGRYGTGDLSKAKAVVAQGNTDISNQNWYVQYQKSKTIAQGTGASSSMIWGCQWDAIMKWFLSDEDTKEYVTNSVEENHQSVKNIYDMFANGANWTIEAYYTDFRAFRRRRIRHWFVCSSSH